ncbi:MAG: chromosome segregation protein SMC [Deltaproteobacteria bacterium]|nr:chromosome segregation protein SMC [Deltaproteobacteria bacterium]
MKIKNLELCGFKSFVDRTVFEFPTGITAVVGPNGCGKSNIVDAIRWSMGEMSAKHLRGKSMEDVIFNGSAKRSPVNMAEVTITFSTEDGIAPPQYAGFSEISITRRVFRDMESEYLINKVPCRLRDVLELFMGTGVGTKAYAIVEQGHIADLVSARAADRRGLIEEAAGITKYKSRKNAALRKLEATDQNLLRVNDIVHEVRRQMGSLERQARRAERFKTLRDELRLLDIDLSARQSRSLAREVEEGSERLAVLGRELDSLSASIASDEGAAEALRLEMVEHERALERKQTELFDLKSTIARHESRIDLLKKDRENLQLQQARGGTEIERLRGECSRFESERVRVLGDRDTALKGLKEKETAQSEAEALLAQVVTREVELAEEIQRAGEALSARIAEAAAVERSIAELRQRQSEVKERAEAGEGGAGELRLRLMSLAPEIESTTTKLQRERAEKDGQVLERESRVARVESLRGEVAELETAWHTAREGLRVMESRLSSLREFEAGYEGYQDGVRVILSREREGGGGSGRVLGLLTEAIEAPTEYEKAVEAALGERLQSVVVRDLDDGIESVKYLKASGSGRSSFLPLALRQREQATGAPPDPVLAPPLARFLRVEPPYHDVVEALLRRVYVVDTLERAAAIWRAGGFDGTLVTKEGDVLDPTGMMTGGSARATGGLISRKREIREMDGGLPETQAACERAEAAFTERKAALEAAQRALEEAGSALHARELDSVSLERALERLEAERDALSRALSLREEDVRSIAGSFEQLGRDLDQAVSRQQQLGEERTARESEIATLRERRASLVVDLDAARLEATELRVESAGLIERGQGLEQEAQRLGQSILESDARAQSLQEEIEGAQTRIAAIETELVACDEALAVLMVQHAQGGDALGKDREGIEAFTVRLQAIDSRVRELRHAHQARGEQVNKFQVAQKEIELRLQHLTESVYEKYQVRLDDLEIDEAAVVDHEAREARRAELRAQLERLGEVSLGAIEEYQELSERYRFLTEQSEDLRRTIESLQNAIQKINRTSRKLFIDTFEQVSKKFEETFPQLFNGGKARLSLTEGEDVLEAGVEIVAQPPGKRLQNVTLLSGGEKTLTAVSLLFAIFQVRPSPFFLLDEVDAALDDANVGRFNTLLHEMTARSQFVLITHNKATIELADTLYGITMEDPGISKVVSVKLQ